MMLPDPPYLQSNPCATPPVLPPYWHAVALCTPFTASQVAIAEVWCDSTAGTMRVLQCDLDGTYIDMLFAGASAYLLESQDGGAPTGVIGPFATSCKVPDGGWFASLGLRSPGRQTLLGVDADWWVGLTACTNQNNPDNPPAPVAQVANWFWFRSDSGMPLQMMFVNQSNPYRLPVLGDFAKLTFSRFEQQAESPLAALLAQCRANARAPASTSSATLDNPTGRAALAAGAAAGGAPLAARLLPGLRAGAEGDALPEWPARCYLTSFSLATYDRLPNAPYPTRVYYDGAHSSMLTRFDLQDGTIEDLILDGSGTSIVRRLPDGIHACGPRLPVGTPYRDWMQRDGGVIMAAIDDHPLLCPGGTLLLINLPSVGGRVFWAWYTSEGVPVSFLEAPQCCNVQLILTEYHYFSPVNEPFDPALFVVPADCVKGALHEH